MRPSCMNYRINFIALLTAINALAGCRERKESIAATAASVDRPADYDPRAYQIAVSTEKLISATWTTTASDAEYLARPVSAEARNLIAERGPGLLLYKLTRVPASDLNEPADRPAFIRRKNSFIVSGIRGIKRNHEVPLISAAAGDKIPLSQISTGLFQSCPRQLKTKSVLVENHGNTSELVMNESGVPKVTFMTLSESSILWTITCDFHVSFREDKEPAAIVTLNFDLRVTSNVSLFPEAGHSDGLGTKKGPTSQYQWDIASSHLVIDDIHDAYGIPLSRRPQGTWISESMRVAAADLRLKLPKLGQRIRLKSEGSPESPQIQFRWQERDGEVLPDFKIVNDRSGQVKRAVLSLMPPDENDALRKISLWFKQRGLIDNGDLALKESFQLMALESLGKALGLRYTLAGYGLYNNWGNDLQTIMSFGHSGMPSEYLTDKIEFKEADITSLSHLFMGEAGDGRSAEASEAALYPERQQPIHLMTALAYLSATNHPKIKSFRDSAPDWKRLIQELYMSSYGIYLDETAPLNGGAHVP